MNSGERDELLIKLQLVKMRDTGLRFKGHRINSVGFGRHEYSSLPSDIPRNLNLLDDYELSDLASSVGISKAGIFHKSDVYINNLGYSLKSFSAAPPAIVNHTARPGFETACNYTDAEINELDEIIDEYWYLREQGIITEDVRNSNTNSPFRDNIEVFEPVLNYFLFIGSGRGPSRYEADYIIDYHDPLRTETWNILSHENAVESIWDNLIFSMRAKKGMPNNYDMNTYAGPNAESIARWTRFCNGDYRGALHIRVHK